MGNCQSGKGPPVVKTSFPNLGIKFSYLSNEFIEECGGKAVLAGLTTREVCEKFIERGTIETKSTYCEMLSKSGETKEFVGEATTFICHAWEYEFLQLVSALEDTFKDKPRSYIWLDIFSFNQHETLYLDQKWCLNVFLPAFTDIDHTVMVIDHFKDPLCYSRSWCILEAYCTHLSNGRFEVAMTDETRKSFFQDAEDDPKAVFDALAAKIDCENSQVTNLDDATFLRELFKIECGFSKMNAAVFKQLRSFIIDMVKKAINESSEDTKRQDALWNALNIFYSYMGDGIYEPSKEMLEDNLDERKSSLGERHPETQRAMHNLGLYYLENGKDIEAKEILSDCLRSMKETRGLADRDTVKLIGDLTTVYENLKDFRNAERLYMQLLGEQRDSLGASHADTIASLLSLEILRKSMKDSINGDLQASAVTLESHVAKLERAKSSKKLERDKPSKKLARAKSSKKSGSRQMMRSVK
jgi:chaperonin cofactor prefoldin